MEKFIIDPNQSLKELITKQGSAIEVFTYLPEQPKSKPNITRFRFMPFWFEENEDGKWTAHGLGSLPVELRDEIERVRNNKTVFDSKFHESFPAIPEDAKK